jgi:hypothetical protein
MITHLEIGVPEDLATIYSRRGSISPPPPSENEAPPSGHASAVLGNDCAAALGDASFQPMICDTWRTQTPQFMAYYNNPT